MSPDGRLRVVIASPGVGRVQRGFERMFADLFRLMQGEVDMTLLKGGGPVSERERVPLFLHRNGRAIRTLPVHRLFGRTPFHSECALFALGMLPYLRGGAIDVVHTIDAPLTRLLYRLRDLLGLRFALLYTEGTGMPPSDYPPADHTQQVAPVLMQSAVAAGRLAASMSMVPCGFFPERFTVHESRVSLRVRYGIPPETFVVLSVAALNRTQKRIGYLIDEVAQLDGDIMLLLDGSMDHGDSSLPRYAAERLGARVRVSHVPSVQVGELYALADVLAHVSQRESFGLAIAEAAGTGLPVIIHDAPHFRWLVRNPNCWIDTSRPGALAAKLRAVMAAPALLKAMSHPQDTLDRFSWHRLKPQYTALYQTAAATRRSVVAGGRPRAA